jgi:uncharacterized membrane protein YfcA
MSIELGLVVIGFGVFVGVLSALFGVGGGIVMVPFMVLALGDTQHVAEGTSLLVIVPTAAAGVFAMRNSGHVAYRSALWLAVGGVGGSALGALLALKLSSERLEDIFAILVVISGVRLIVDAIRRAQSSDENGNSEETPTS